MNLLQFYLFTRLHTRLKSIEKKSTKGDPRREKKITPRLDNQLYV